MLSIKSNSDDSSTSSLCSEKLIRSAFVKLRLSLGCVGSQNKDITDDRTVAKSVYRLDDVLKYQLFHLVVGKNTDSCFLRFFVRSVTLFRSLMLTPYPYY